MVEKGNRGKVVQARQSAAGQEAQRKQGLLVEQVGHSRPCRCQHFLEPRATPEGKEHRKVPQFLIETMQRPHNIGKVGVDLDEGKEQGLEVAKHKGLGAARSTAGT